MHVGLPVELHVELPGLSGLVARPSVSYRAPIHAPISNHIAHQPRPSTRFEIDAPPTDRTLPPTASTSASVRPNFASPYASLFVQWNSFSHFAPFRTVLVADDRLLALPRIRAQLAKIYFVADVTANMLGARESVRASGA
jgi:hypothetical protein